jgi:hypothetical protein
MLHDVMMLYFSVVFFLALLGYLAASIVNK